MYNPSLIVNFLKPGDLKENLIISVNFDPAKSQIIFPVKYIILIVLE